MWLLSRYTYGFLKFKAVNKYITFAIGFKWNCKRKNYFQIQAPDDLGIKFFLVICWVLVDMTIVLMVEGWVVTTIDKSVARCLPSSSPNLYVAKSPF